VPCLDPKSLTSLKGEAGICFKNFSKYMLVGPGTGYGISMIVNQ
jgi:glucokinase